jgi:hypothetical protein
MIEFINKYQRFITGAGALSVLVLCYFQEIEIRELRASLKKVEETKNAIAKIDSMQNDLYQASIIIDKYDRAIDEFKQTNPSEAAELENKIRTIE